MKVDDLKKMSPEERIRLLKEFETEKNKEIEEAQKLMIESERQLSEEEEIRQKIPIPQIKAVSIDSLFSPEEKQVYAVKRFVKEEEPEEVGEEEGKLEKAVAESKPKLSEAKLEEREREYIIQLVRQPTEDFYSRVHNIYQEARQQREESGSVSEELREQIRNVYVEQREREAAQREGVYNIPESMEEKFNIAKDLVKNLMNWYRG